MSFLTLSLTLACVSSSAHAAGFEYDKVLQPETFCPASDANGSVPKDPSKLALFKITRWSWGTEYGVRVAELTSSGKYHTITDLFANDSTKPTRDRQLAETARFIRADLRHGICVGNNPVGEGSVATALTRETKHPIRWFENAVIDSSEVSVASTVAPDTYSNGSLSFLDGVGITISIRDQSDLVTFVFPGHQDDEQDYQQWNVAHQNALNYWNNLIQDAKHSGCKMVINRRAVLGLNDNHSNPESVMTILKSSCALKR